jgi:hypothetical protein
VKETKQNKRKNILKRNERKTASIYLRFVAKQKYGSGKKNSIARNEAKRKIW